MQFETQDILERIKANPPYANFLGAAQEKMKASRMRVAV
jgi:hypothetical protein